MSCFKLPRGLFVSAHNIDVKTKRGLFSIKNGEMKEDTTGLVGLVDDAEVYGSHGI
jgi:hypothetical protein